MPKPDAGYNEPYPDDEGMDPVIFSVEEYREQHTSAGLTLSVTRNGNGIGIIRVKNRAEYDWIWKRLNGTFEPED